MHLCFKAANQREIKGSCSQRRRKQGAMGAEERQNWVIPTWTTQRSEQSNSDPIRNTRTRRFWTAGGLTWKKDSQLLTNLSSEVFSELESKSWGKALRGGWPEIPTAQSSSEELPTPSQSDSPFHRGSRATPVPQLQKMSQNKWAVQGAPFHSPSRNHSQVELMSWALPGIQVVSQTACPVPAEKSKEFNFCQIVSFPTLVTDFPHDEESPLDTFKYIKQSREAKVTERTEQKGRNIS